MKTVVKRPLLIVALTMIFLALLVLSPLLIPAVGATPLAAPTSVTSVQQGTASAPANVTFKAQTVMTADAGGPAQSLAAYSLLDVQYVIDETLVNTTTLTLQFSNDGANWVNGPALVTGETADGTGLNQYANFGRYSRVYIDVSNTNPITVTVLGVAKP